jgi:putative SOS response-associated peptidase YedK
MRLAETVASKPAFRGAFKSRRCLVPTGGFYEWKKLDAKIKQPYHFAWRTRGPSLLAVGALEEPASGETVRRFTIITTTPDAL